MKRHFALGAIVSALFLPSHAKASTSNWSTTCRLTQCEIATSAFETGNKNPVLTIAVLVGSDRSDPQLLATMPLGTALEPGARAKFGNTTLSLKFKACYPDGCRAHTILDASLLDAIAAAPTLEFRYFAQSSERQLSASIPLQGLAEALASLSKQN